MQVPVHRSFSSDIQKKSNSKSENKRSPLSSDVQKKSKSRSNYFAKNEEYLAKHEGAGILEYGNGDRFEGEFLQGNRHGPGTIIYANGDVFKGTFQNDKVWHGEGVYHWRSGDIYYGAYVSGKMHGFAEIRHKDGRISRGEFREGKQYSGVGYRQMRDGGGWRVGIYNEGEFKFVSKEQAMDELLKTPNSTFATIDARSTSEKLKETLFTPGSYTGDQTQDGERHGVGSLLSDQFVYEGTFHNNQRSGFGKATYADDSVYEGYWQLDRQHGEGKITYADGSTLQGVFQDGQIWNGHGTSILKLPKQGWVRQMGTFVNGQLEGLGSSVRSTGECYEGEWKNGKRHGQGVLTQATGERLEGEFRYNAIYNGSGALKKYNGTVLQGTWVEGKLQQ
jgi:hypothetical protein